MTASEFAFLALGLLLGVATGAALIEVIRARPTGGPEVRVVVERDSVPRRATTLAGSAFVEAEPARGGPADRRAFERDVADGGRPRVGLTSPAGLTTPPPLLSLGPLPARAISIAREPDPQLSAIRSVAPPSAVAVADRPGVGRGDSAGDAGRPRAARGDADSPASSDGEPPRPAAGPVAAEPAGDDEPSGLAGPCADLRHVAEERCAVATRSRAQATAAADALRAAQREYDDHHDRAERADELADPRAVRAAKDQAQRRFRRERDGATGRDAVEAAARTWLAEINRINNQAREAAAAATSARAGANQLVVTIERLTVEADAARIKAESADEACVLARQAAADCEEAEQRERAARPPFAPAGDETPESAGAGSAAAAPGPGDDERVRLGLGGRRSDEDGDVGGRLATAEAPLLQILRGDRPVMAAVAAAMGGDDVAERRRWQLALANLADAIIARAIEASALEFPADDPFWGPFTRDQCRDIVGALASLGFRFDGLGGFVDERVPSQRDLSLAVGFAGLDPMRIRHWPNEQEMTGLFDRVSVAADEYLADAAGGLTLGELVSLLGRRADGLTEVWNAWGRLRPLLLEPR